MFQKDILLDSLNMFRNEEKWHFFKLNLYSRISLRASAHYLRAISGIVHTHHSCGGKRGKLSGSRLSTINRVVRYAYFVCQMDNSAFSGQNKVS